MNWKLRHVAETVSTNLDAREGAPGDVFTADFQTAGRGRLDHVWTSPRGKDLLMSVVLPVAGLEPQAVATLPLVVGLAVCKALAGLAAPSLKWPNDVLVGGRKLAGVLCERHGDRVIAGIGVNVGARAWPPELAGRAVSLAELVPPPAAPSVPEVRDRVLQAVGRWFGTWIRGGFAAVHPEIAALDALKGRVVAVRQTDDDGSPAEGVCGGINPDGSLDVGGAAVYAGEAHVERTASAR